MSEIVDSDGVEVVDGDDVGDEEGEYSILSLWGDSVEQGTKQRKRRVYIQDPSEAPEGAEVHEGSQGGLYYETESAAGGGSGDDNDLPDDREAEVDPDREV